MTVLAAGGFGGAFGAGPASAQGRGAAVSPAPGSREYARETGFRLLTEGRWTEAAEAYAGTYEMWSDDLQDGVARAWDRAAVGTAGRNDPYLLALLEFYFRHMDFSGRGWFSHDAAIARYGRQYAVWAKGRPPSGREPPLDFFGLELFSQMARLADRGKASEDDWFRVESALREAPDAVPVAGSALCLLEAASRESDGEVRRSALERVRARLVGPWGRLALARKVAAGWPPEDARYLRLVAPILEANWDSAPGAEEKAHLLYKLAYMKAALAKPYVGAGSAEQALRAAAEVYERFPRAHAAAPARGLAAQILLDAGRVDDALALVRTLQARSDQQAGLADALLSISTGYFHKEDYARSEAGFLEILREHPRTSLAPRAMLGVAEVYTATGDGARELEMLRRCAAFDRTDPGIMDTDNTRSIALRRLGRLYERRRQWREALLCWQDWTPDGGCGTCRSSQEDERLKHSVHCLVQLGDFPGIARLYLDALVRGDSGDAEGAACWLFRLYQAAGQGDDLLGLADAIDQAAEAEYRMYVGLVARRSLEEMERARVGWPIRELVRIQALADARVVAGLISVCREEDREPWGPRPPEFEAGFEWRGRAAAEGLAACGDEAVGPIRAILTSPPPSERQSDAKAGAGEVEAESGSEDVRSRSWLIYALGRQESPAALELLDELSRRAREHWECFSIIHALGLRGEAGLAMVRRLAESAADETLQREAQRRLAPADGERDGAGGTDHDDVPEPVFDGARRGPALPRGLP